MNFTPWSGSNFRAAVTSPTVPSWIRSEREAPRVRPPLARVKRRAGRYQPHVPLLDQVREGDAAVLVLLGHADHEAQVGAHQLAHRVFVARAGAPAQLDLLRAGEQLVGAHLLQVLVEAGLVLGGRAELGVSAGRRPLPLAWGGAAGL